LQHNFFAVVPAAGSGTRMGGSGKLLQSVSGSSVLARSVTCLLSHERIERVLIAHRESDLVAFTEILMPVAQYFEKKLEFVVGGKTRRESVLNCLNYIRHSQIDTANLSVVVHDAARPFLSQALLNRVLDAAEYFEALTCAMPVVDTLRKVSGENEIVGQLEREGVWAIQTPQVFSFELLWEAHARAAADPLLQAVTDDSTLVSALRPVKVIEGERVNFKITTVDDLRLAESIS